MTSSVASLPLIGITETSAREVERNNSKSTLILSGLVEKMQDKSKHNFALETSWSPGDTPIVDQKTSAEQPVEEISKRIISYEEISNHNTETDAWIVVDGKVYDVTNFLETHPGGPELLLEQLNGKDVGSLMRGKDDLNAHGHSKSAFRMLQQFLIGSVTNKPGIKESIDLIDRNAASKFTVDLTKPIVSQVGYLGSDYDKWVHDPIVCKESPRFFENDFYEALTKTHWWVIPMVWLPVGIWMEWLSVQHGLSSTKIPGLMVSGALIWTFLEYMLHRFLFHMKTSSFWGNTAHYMLHGFHHKHPMDGARLVMPPAFTSVFVVGIWILVGNWVAPFPIKCALYGGALCGYVAYDLLHYFLHFGLPFNELTRRMKRYHLNHHFKDQKNGYGITSTFWDWAFCTLPTPQLSPSL